MKTLIKKEIRLLLPGWITAMLLAVVPGILNIIWENTTSDESLFLFVLLIFAAGVLFLGINSFGEEMSCNTFSGLLSQPIKRPRIWLIKIATLATAFISVWLTGILLALWQTGILGHWSHYDFGVAFEFITLSALVAFSGGLWTTLLLRQITGAFWFTLLTPLVIILGISAVFQDWITAGRSFNTFVVIALVIYSVAGFLLARRLFMRAQDVQWTGGEITLPRRERPSKASWRHGSATLPVRSRHWHFALAWKELQLHQGAFLIAAIVLALHATAFTYRKFHPHIQNPDFEFALEAIWILWLLMPLLIGAATIAEERRMGTLEPQLCLPVSRRMQLFIKFFIALVLSLVFGALAPVLIEGTQTLNQWPWIFFVAAAMFLASFYASSLGRMTLQSIGLAILVALAVRALGFGDGFNSMASQNQYIGIGTYHSQFFDTLGFEIQYLDAAILLTVYSWLTYSNFKHGHQNWIFWMRNVMASLVVYVCLRILNYEILMVGIQWYGGHYE